LHNTTDLNIGQVKMEEIQSIIKVHSNVTQKDFLLFLIQTLFI